MRHARHRIVDDVHDGRRSAAHHTSSDANHTDSGAHDTAGSTACCIHHADGGVRNSFEERLKRVGGSLSSTHRLVSRAWDA